MKVKVNEMGVTVLASSCAISLPLKTEVKEEEAMLIWAKLVCVFPRYRENILLRSNNINREGSIVGR